VITYRAHELRMRARTSALKVFAGGFAVVVLAAVATGMDVWDPETGAALIVWPALAVPVVLLVHGAIALGSPVRSVSVSRARVVVTGPGRGATVELDNGRLELVGSSALALRVRDAAGVVHELPLHVRVDGTGGVRHLLAVRAGLLRLVRRRDLGSPEIELGYGDEDDLPRARVVADRPASRG
jgi:hypothetical protein